MPTFIGTLSSGDQQQPLALAAQQSGAIILPTSVDSSASNTPPVAGSAPDHAATGSGSNATKEEAWVPSGGKKLDTGLSIVLENVASGFKRPNVIDVKLGARLWAEDAPLSKRGKLDAVSRETTSGSLGFRIAGMKVWTGENGENDEGAKTDPYATKYEGKEGEKGEVVEKDGFRRYDKWYGRSLNDSNVREGFATFLAGAKTGSTDRSKLLAARLAEDLRRVQKAIEVEESRMYSASILVVYEGDPEAMEHALVEEAKPKEISDESEGEDEDFELELQPDGSFQVVDLPGGQPGAPQQAINITVDPETAQMGQIGELEDEDEEEAPKVHDLRLIDFAHAEWTPGQGPDENVLMGIRNLAKIFEAFASD